MPNLNQFCDFTKLTGIDIAKSVFQIYNCDTQTGEITNVQIKRDKVLESLANCGKCLIGMEACGSSQYWARKLQALGHTVRMMDPKLVKPFVRYNKSDKADAGGVYHALVSGVRAVAVKTETERDILTLLTMRALLVKQRTARINHVRGLLAEYGHVMPKSVDQFDKKVDECINSLEGDAVQLVIDTLRDTVKSIRDDQDRIKTLQREISRLASQTKNAKHFLTVPGVGDSIMAYMCVCSLLIQRNFLRAGSLQLILAWYQCIRAVAARLSPQRFPADAIKLCKLCWYREPMRWPGRNAGQTG